MLSEKPIDFDRFVRWLLAAAAIVALYFLLRQIGGVLMPFALAWLTAYLMNPIVVWLMRWTNKRKWAVVITLSMMTIVIATLALLMIPAIANESAHLYELLTQRLVASNWPAWIPPSLLAQVQQRLAEMDYASLLTQEGIGERLASVGEFVWSAISGVYGVIGALFSVVTYALYLVFILIDYDRIAGGWIELVPEKYKSTLSSVANDLELGMNNYFRAQTKIVLTVTLLFCIGFKIIGMPFAIAMGLMAGLFNYVPYLQLAAIPPALMLSAVGSMEEGSGLWISMALTLLVFTIVQLVQDLFLTPRFLGAVSGFNPAIVLLSLSIWGALLGMIGLIIAIPVTTLLMAYYRRYLSGGSLSSKEL